MTGSGQAGRGTPSTCPDCGSSRIAPIQYGEPAWSATLGEDIAAGRVVLGGCVLSDDMPTHRCLACGSGIGRVAMNGLDDEPNAIAVAVYPSRSLSQPRVVGRLVLTGTAASKSLRPDPALLLDAACDELALRGGRVRYLLTPAGFLRPKLAPGQARSHGWTTQREDFKTLIDIATYEVSEFLAGSLLTRLRQVADHLVIGVDPRAPDHHGRPYGETALVVRTNDGRVVGWTGKSYPTVQQQSHLIRNGDAANHLMKVGRDRVAVLVCHDLVAFGKRSEKNRRSTRATVGRELEDALSGDPTVVLHLPHTLDGMTTWSPAWRGLLDRHGSPDTVWASAIKYRTSSDAKPGKPLPLRLLQASSSGVDGVLDIVLGNHAAVQRAL